MRNRTLDRPLVTHLHMGESLLNPRWHTCTSPSDKIQKCSCLRPLVSLTQACVDEFGYLMVYVCFLEGGRVRVRVLDKGIQLHGSSPLGLPAIPRTPPQLPALHPLRSTNAPASFLRVPRFPISSPRSTMTLDRSPSVGCSFVSN